MLITTYFLFRPKSVPNSPMVKRAISRLGTITAGWGRSIRKQHSQLNNDDRKKWTSSQDCSGKSKFIQVTYKLWFNSNNTHNIDIFLIFLVKEGKEKGKGKNKAGASATPRLSVCADQQKVDKAILEQTEVRVGIIVEYYSITFTTFVRRNNDVWLCFQFTIIEFEPDTFSILLDYLHSGCCSLSCLNIPGLICAAEHFDIPELLQACFHHAKQFLKTEVVSLTSKH